MDFMKYLKKKLLKVLQVSKMFVPLQPQSRNKP